MFMVVVVVLNAMVTRRNATQRNVDGYDQPRTLGQLGQLTEILLN
jgi:hypothetical protein